MKKVRESGKQHGRMPCCNCEEKYGIQYENKTYCQKKSRIVDEKLLRKSTFSGIV